MAEAVASSRAFCLESKSPVGKISDFIWSPVFLYFLLYLLCHPHLFDLLLVLEMPTLCMYRFPSVHFFLSCSEKFYIYLWKGLHLTLSLLLFGRHQLSKACVWAQKKAKPWFYKITIKSACFTLSLSSGWINRIIHPIKKIQPNIWSCGCKVVTLLIGAKVSPAGISLQELPC
jgi:hypothetical protein